MKNVIAPPETNSVALLRMKEIPLPENPQIFLTVSLAILFFFTDAFY
jgi:hypothetical protein